MNDQVHVKFESLSAGADNLMATFKSLEAALDDMESQLQPMLSRWDGAARDAYFVQKKNWDNAAAAMSQTLSQMGRAVSDAHQEYVSAEKRNQALWS